MNKNSNGFAQVACSGCGSMRVSLLFMHTTKYIIEFRCENCGLIAHVGKDREEKSKTVVKERQSYVQ